MIYTNERTMIYRLLCFEFTYIALIVGFNFSYWDEDVIRVYPVM